MRFRSDPPPGNETTRLLRPESDDWNEGEIDFPGRRPRRDQWVDSAELDADRIERQPTDPAVAGDVLIGWAAIDTWTGRPRPRIGFVRDRGGTR